MSLVISRKRVTARKAHRCECCNAVAIQPGQEYERQTCVADGRIYDWVSCTDCDDLFSQVWEWAGEPWDYGIGMDAYQEWAEENVNDETWGQRARAHLTRRGITWGER